MKKMKVLLWLRHYQNKASTSLFFHPDEQLLTVVNGSAKVMLVSPLYSEKLPFDDETLLAIPSLNTGNKYIHYNVYMFMFDHVITKRIYPPLEGSKLWLDNSLLSCNVNEV